MLQHSNTDSSLLGEANLTALPGGIDSVYFLMWPGWKDELRSNRWHYAMRWSHVAPVVLVQPDLPPSHFGDGITVPEPRIPNCRILHIEGKDCDSPLMILNQVAQTRADMQAHGYRRPLLWIYNPRLIGLFCGLPAVMRVVHSTENYFEFSSIPDELLEQLKLCLHFSDLAVAASSGVARSIAMHVPDANVTVVSNGCDYGVYAAGRPDRELMALRQGYSKVAVYAGNINLRIDFDLLLSCAERFAEMLFVLMGPVRGNDGSDSLDPADRPVWEAILQLPNCRYLGAIDADRLPDMYAAADVGIIPYKDSRVIRESGFALKAMEMLASGLPVVSTLMRPLSGLTAGLAVVDNASDFVRTLGRLDRGALSQEAQTHMAALCRANDYDCKFRQILATMAKRVEPDVPVVSHVATLLAKLRGSGPQGTGGEDRLKLLAQVQWLHNFYGEATLQRETEIEPLEFTPQQDAVNAVNRGKLLADVRWLQAVYGENKEKLLGDVRRLQAVYGEDKEKLLAEIQRLHAVYGDDRQNLVTDIRRLQAVYLEDRSNLIKEIERLQAVYAEQTVRYEQEVRQLQGTCGEQVRQLQETFGEAVQQRNCEIDRLHRVYGEEVVQRNCEIERLHTVYLEAIRERDVANERLAAELRYVRRFRIAAQRIPGMRMLLKRLRSLSALVPTSKM